jgi:serine/threonine protein kinase
MSRDDSFIKSSLENNPVGGRPGLVTHDWIKCFRRPRAKHDTHAIHTLTHELHTRTTHVHFTHATLVQFTHALHTHARTSHSQRWSSPEVVAEGRYSKQADVYSFGIVLWELLTWQEPWAGVNSFQILISLGDGSRPQIPAAEELPGQLGAPAAVADYIRLLQECWDA